MNNLSISFGQKIPTAQCSVLDKKKDRFIPAILYELDCSDSSDIDEISNIKAPMPFKNSIAANMRLKYAYQKISSRKGNLDFYIFQTDEEKTLGICQVKKVDNNIEIDYISTLQDKRYKYAGQSMLAAIGMRLLKKNGSKLIIGVSTEDALPFYTEKCGFKQTQNEALKMNKKHIQKFIRRTQKKTNSPIIDLRG